MVVMPRVPSLAILAVLALAVAGAAAAPEERLESEGRPALGLAAAPVTVIEVASFKCSHCRDFHRRIFPVLKTDYIDTGKVRWIVLNADDDPAEEFAPVFAAARCALLQGEYWGLLDALFQDAARPSSVFTERFSRHPLLRRGEFGLCLRDRETRHAIAADFAAYRRLQVRGTPSFLISRRDADGGRTETTIAGVQTLARFREVLDALVLRP
jgi:protein-disulfide isomerase